MATGSEVIDHCDLLDNQFDVNVVRGIFENIQQDHDEGLEGEGLEDEDDEAWGHSGDEAEDDGHLKDSTGSEFFQSVGLLLFQLFARSRLVVCSVGQSLGRSVTRSLGLLGLGTSQARSQGQ